MLLTPMLSRCAILLLLVFGGIVSSPGGQFDLEKGREHWAYRPVKKAPVPKTADEMWPRNEIDRFILAAGEAKKLRPASDASREVLVRRLSFDLTGLPPTVDEVDAFLNDDAPQAVERVVERLLGSPHFGERWGRHWLDVARFAESVTLRGLVFNEAWRYRDYAIESFNRDLPFDEFVREQIAGDLLNRSGLEEQWRARIATTFLVLGNFNYEEQDKEQLRMDIVDEQLDTIGKAFLGQTLGCARCHDHKFDPIPARDYYAMAGILRNTRSAEHANVSTWLEVPLPLSPEEEERVKERETRIAELQHQVRKLTSAIAERKAESETADAEKRELEKLRGELKAITDAGPKRPRAMSVKEEAKIADCPIHLRGSVHRLGEIAPRGFLRVADYGSPAEFRGDQSGRRELAEWLGSASNPLTARVYVNRVWHWLLGAGIVRTTDNFGSAGEMPSNPELLDYLADGFVQHGWSTKWLVRKIVLSRTYQLSSESTFGLEEGDAENRLFLRARRKRLDAEAMRDAILQASGTLDLSFGGATIEPGTSADYGYVDSETRRSVYVPAFRNALPQIFELFDFADTSVVSGQRNSSIVAPQALYLLNHPFLIEQAALTAKRVWVDTFGAEGRVQTFYRLILGRSATEREQTIARAFTGTEEGCAELCQALFASAEFRFVY